MKIDKEREKNKHLVLAFTNWLDASVISNLIADELEEKHLPVNFSNMKIVWLSLLEEIPDMIRAEVFRRRILIKEILIRK